MRRQRKRQLLRCNNARMMMLGVLALAQMSAPAIANQSPIIDEISTSSTIVPPSGTLTLTVAAHDPDCADICEEGCGQTIRSDLTGWSAEAGTFTTINNLSTRSPYAATAKWQAPASEGVFRIEVLIADSGSFMCGDRLSATAELLINVSATANLPPVVDAVTSDFSRLFPGQEAHLECSASDPDNEELDYSWETNVGSVVVQEPGRVIFLANEPGAATISCTVTDAGGATAVGSIMIPVSDVNAARAITTELNAPHQMDADSMGSLYVADRSAGGISVFHMGTGTLMYHLPMDGVSAVAVDWSDRLLVGTQVGARIVDRAGNLITQLGPRSAMSEVTDVEIDSARQRYVVLYRNTAQVAVFDSNGSRITTFPGKGQLKTPQGVSVTPSGSIVVADSSTGLLSIFDGDGIFQTSCGGLGSGSNQFVHLTDVDVDPDGVIFASDSFLDVIKTFNPDCSLREILGGYGTDVGELKTPAGLKFLSSYNILAATSVNSSSVQLFDTSPSETPDWLAPESNFSTEFLQFPNQSVGTASAPMSFNVTNSGNAPLGIRDITVTGPFTITRGCSFIDPGSACSFFVTFLPSSPGVHIGRIEVSASDMEQAHAIELQGEGFIPAAAVFNPSRLDFPTQVIGRNNRSQDIVLSNPGTAPLHISAIMSAGNFVVSSTCGSALASGASCTIETTYAPTDAGEDEGSLTILSDAAGSPNHIPLTGNAVTLEVTANPQSLSFPSTNPGQTSDPQLIEALNTGSAPVWIEAVQIQGDDAGDFVLASESCSETEVAVGKSCFIEVVLQPTEAGVRLASLEFSYAETLRSSVSLTGGDNLIFSDGFEIGDLSLWDGVFPPSGSLSVEPPWVNFDPIELGAKPPTQAVKLTNVSNEAIGISTLIGPDSTEFILESDFCSGTWLEPNEFCRFTIVLLTLDDGKHQTYIEIYPIGSTRMPSQSIRVIGTIVWPGYENALDEELLQEPGDQDQPTGIQDWMDRSQSGNHNQ